VITWKSASVAFSLWFWIWETSQKNFPVHQTH
jgi:hypothetical protein